MAASDPKAGMDSDTPPAPEHTQDLITKLVNLSKIASTQYPSGTDHRFFGSYPAFQEQSNTLSKRVLSLLTKVCTFVDPASSASDSNSTLNLLAERNEYLRWQTISDSADHCIERVDTCLDQINDPAIPPTSNPTSQHSFKKQAKLFANDKQSNTSSYNALELLYPQASFLSSINNKRNSPFKPDFPYNKPNATIPLSQSLSLSHTNHQYSHPYLHEIQNLTRSRNQLTPCSHIPNPPSLINTPLYWIDTLQSLIQTVSRIEHCETLSIDVEHHSKHSFLGLTCLIQLSTHSADYILDALALRAHLHKHLLPLLTNPNIVKILHGCSQDIQWLQRDFSLYIVNLFDTFEAAKLLKLRAKRLDNLIEHFCGVETPRKSLRLTDWRVRPLRPELIEYARCDTHYLLYLYGVMTQRLVSASTVKRDLLEECYRRCDQLCLIRYEKRPEWSKNGWMELCKRRGWYFVDGRALEVVQGLVDWRDRVARDLDQSVCAVMRDNVLRSIANGLPDSELCLEQCVLEDGCCLSVIAKRFVGDLVAIVSGCGRDKEKMIDVMFECKRDENGKKGLGGLDEIVKSTEGCFDEMDGSIGVLDAGLGRSVVKVRDGEDLLNGKGFFPLLDEPVVSVAQPVVDRVFAEIASTPVFSWQGIRVSAVKEVVGKGKKKRVKKKRKDGKDGRDGGKFRIKKNNVDPVADDEDRGKIFGSRYLDKNTHLDVFALPRSAAGQSRKRKQRDDDVDGVAGPVLENIEPALKKQRMTSEDASSSVVEETEEEKEVRERQMEREKMTTAVEDEWPIGKDKDMVERVADKKKRAGESAKMVRKPDEADKDVQKVTEEDLLDDAPVPVLNTTFDNVYQPFS